MASSFGAYSLDGRIVRNDDASLPAVEPAGDYIVRTPLASGGESVQDTGYRLGSIELRIEVGTYSLYTSLRGMIGQTALLTVNGRAFPNWTLHTIRGVIEDVDGTVHFTALWRGQLTGNLLMTFRLSSLLVLIDGVPTTVESCRTMHGVDNPIGDCTIMVRTPLPTWLTTNNGPAGKKVSVTATMTSWDGIDGAGQTINPRTESGIIFRGSVRSANFAWDPSGNTRTLYCLDDLWTLGRELYQDRAWNGPILANQIIRGGLADKSYRRPDAAAVLPRQPPLPGRQ